MITITKAVEECLTQLETINERIRQIQEDYKVLTLQLHNLKNNPSDVLLLKNPQEQKEDKNCTAYLMKVFEQYNWPLNMDELTRFFELHYADKIPPQIINVKSYLYRYVRKGLSEGIIQQQQYRGHNRPYYVSGSTSNKGSRPGDPVMIA